MLIAISGSQGSGKSTILKRIKDLGFNTVERKTSRSILDEWGVTLQQVNNDYELTIRFQEEIIERKRTDELESITSSNLFFTERTFADLFSYSLITLGKDNSFNTWLNTYYTKCMKYNQGYSLAFYLKAGYFLIEDDGVRGSNTHYSRMVDLIMLDFTQQMTHPSKLNIIDTPTLEQRINIITLQSRSITQGL